MKGFAVARGLSQLSITNCNIDARLLKSLVPGLSRNRSLTRLDLSCNRLDDMCGSMLGKIISAQGQLKDEIIWLTSLRNETPLKDLNKIGIAWY